MSSICFTTCWISSISSSLNWVDCLSSPIFSLFFSMSIVFCISLSDNCNAITVSFDRNSKRPHVYCHQVYIVCPVDILYPESHRRLIHFTPTRRRFCLERVENRQIGGGERANRRPGGVKLSYRVILCR